MHVEPQNVLFLCTGNSARSILAEAILTARAGGKFAGFSAGSQPAGAVNPGAVRKLQKERIDASAYRSKSWDEFAGQEAPEMHCVITVCDSAAGESCPVWPGHPVTAHWGIPDPAAVVGNLELVDDAFDRAFQQLSCRIDRFLDLAHRGELSIAAIRQIGITQEM